MGGAKDRAESQSLAAFAVSASDVRINSCARLDLHVGLSGPQVIQVV
jgi:hypothetical protein